jgi:hypothetical protein
MESDIRTHGVPHAATTPTFRVRRADTSLASPIRVYLNRRLLATTHKVYVLFDNCINLRRSVSQFRFLWANVRQDGGFSEEEFLPCATNPRVCVAGNNIELALLMNNARLALEHTSVDKNWLESAA